MEKLHYIGLLFLNFTILNIILSLLFFVISYISKKVISSMYIKSRVFFISLVAPPIVAAFTVVTSFIPPFFVKLHDGPMLCLNEPYCYIFSFIPDFPMFNGALIAAVVLVILSMFYSIMSLVAYFRQRSTISKLPELTLGDPGSNPTSPPFSKGGELISPFEKGGLRGIFIPIRIKVIDTPLMISFVWGYISNFIVISTGVLKSLSPDELRCVLAHETSHYRRRDNVLKGISLLCRNILFLFPHVYYLFRWWGEEIELIGDEAAVLSAGRPLDVASAIIKMQRKSNPDMNWNMEPFATGFIASAHTGTLTKRVERLVAINDSMITPGTVRSDMIPSEIGMLTGLTFLFPLLFAVIYKIDPLLLHCYLEKITSVL